MTTIAELELGPKGTVAQGTNISTGVTLNARYGQITTQAADAAAAAENAFVLTNSYITLTSIVLLGFSTASAGTPLVQAHKTAAGSCTITITNLSADTALDAAFVITFLVLG